MMRHPLILFLFFVILPTLAQEQPSIRFQHEVHDFGVLWEEQGVVNHEFVFQNTSSNAVAIMAVETSCGCTLVDWNDEPLEPNETGSIEIAFDPLGRPGYFDKIIEVVTDRGGRAQVLHIKGNVRVGSAPSDSARFKVKNGLLGTEVSLFNMGRVYINQPPTAKAFLIYNYSSDSLLFLEANAPDYIQVRIPEAIPPHTSASLEITYDAEARYTYGFQSDQLELVTSDSLSPQKQYSVYATTEELFDIGSQEDIDESPVIRIDSLALDLGQGRKGTAVSRLLMIRNEGQSDLVIRAIQPNCTCLEVKFDPLLLEPGARRPLQILWTASGWTGTQQKAITIYSNDPLKSVQRVVLTLEVRD